MLPPSFTIQNSRHLWTAGLLFILIFSIYSNTFDAFWHLDDYQNILTNPSIQIRDLSLDSLKESIYGPTQRHIWRPVAFLTFAANWYFGGSNVFGYHLVNTIIHLSTAFFLYLVICRLLTAPALKDKYADSFHFIALLATALWAIHPIQTQAITYIVQRMALLSGLFYLICIYCYIRIRTAIGINQKIGFAVSFLVCFLLGLGSKENIMLLPLSLVLIEMIFFFNPVSDRIAWYKKTAAIIAGALLTAGVALWLLNIDPGSVFDGYRNRFYTPGQRLLTEFRVLVFYLSQLFYPIPSRFSIEHDFEISTSLLTPWTTLPAVIMVIGLIAIAILLRRRNPLFSFAILFFFLNHALESTIIPLELVFEHRNYLPSVFIFVPLAVILCNAIEWYRHRRRWMYQFLAGFGVLLLVGLGAGTYIRNYVWASEWSLWTDARKKAPAMTRPLLNLAWSHYEVNGHFDLALRMYNSALKLKMHRRDTRSTIYNNMADVFYRAGNYKKAEDYWRRASASAPAVLKYRYRLSRALAGQKKWDSALAEIDALLKKYPDSIRYLNLRGIILLYQQKPGPALADFGKCLRLNARDPLVLSNTGIAHLALGSKIQAGYMFRAAAALEPDNDRSLMRLIAINLLTHNLARADIHLKRLLSRSSVSKIRKALAALSKDPGTGALHQALAHYLAAVLADKSRRIDLRKVG